MVTCLLVIVMIFWALVACIQQWRFHKLEAESLDEIARWERKCGGVRLERDKAQFELAAADHQYESLNAERINLVHKCEELQAVIAAVRAALPNEESQQ